MKKIITVLALTAGLIMGTATMASADETIPPKPGSYVTIEHTDYVHCNEAQGQFVLVAYFRIGHGWKFDEAQGKWVPQNSLVGSPWMDRRATTAGECANRPANTTKVTKTVSVKCKTHRTTVTTTTTKTVYTFVQFTTPDGFPASKWSPTTTKTVTKVVRKSHKSECR